MKKFQIRDWFVLYQVGKNIDLLVYKHLVGDLALEFADRELNRSQERELTCLDMRGFSELRHLISEIFLSERKKIRLINSRAFLTKRILDNSIAKI